MMHKKRDWRCLVGVCVNVVVLSLVASPAIAKFETSDIAAGMEARLSKVTSLDIHYHIVIDNNDDFFAWQRRGEAESMKRFGRPLGPPIPTYWSPDRSCKLSCRLVESTNLKNYEDYIVEDNKPPRLFLRITYDGEILHSFQPGSGMTGLTRRVGLQQIVSPFETPSTILRPQQASYNSFFGDKSWNIRTENERIEGGDVLITLLITKETAPLPTVTAITQYKVDVNISKDFWPVRLETTFIVEDKNTKQKSAELKERVVLNAFTNAGLIAYPKSVTRTLFATEWHKDPSKFLPDIVSTKPVGTETLIVDDIKINKPIDPLTFKLQYPNGTTVYDDITHLSTIAGDPIPAMADVMRQSIKRPDALADISVVSKPESSTNLGMSLIGMTLIGIACLFAGYIATVVIRAWNK